MPEGAALRVQCFGAASAAAVWIFLVFHLELYAM
jgi:hypothetical protein